MYHDFNKILSSLKDGDDSVVDIQACRHFNNSGQCVEACPPYEIYDTERHQNVRNPNVRYAYGTNCVKQCPGMYSVQVAYIQCPGM